ncbi:serine/threonine protein kinase [Microbacterium sp. SORGH_AS 505]|uniref:serine/threonine-protein kinase n=1 Tax=Microbacterium sp. SORGH_AS_0505 TaxID=3041770 RepID=UPI00277D7207|nr:serine/threonine-protein kinase [Microbacterium sp. SORGH_AS_0505]MDQ1125431.1 serine/threonine protein kinase [Microbacterium sp. SORGH_AS_0505]
MTEPSDEPVTSGMLDGRYVLGPCVGQGGMARVFRAEDVVLGRTVAIKIMRAESENPAILPRARTEMSLLASLNHPSLVTLYDAKIVPGQPEYLVMEFIEGESLAAALQSGPLDADETAGLIGELASGLDVVHRSGIVHRDVKPSNVLLAPSTLPGRRFWAKLADFGVAYLADSTRHTTPGTVIGTAAYLAPEQVRGELAGPPADVYALGLLALETITGDRAFPEASGIGRVMARLVETPEIPAWLGPEWSSLLGDMIARDPGDRPTAGDVALRARSLPTHLVRVPRPTASTLDQETQAFEIAPASAEPVTRAVSASTPDVITRGASGRATRSQRRTRRSRGWIVAGAVGVIAAIHIVLLSSWWADGTPGGGPAPEQTISEPTSPAPAELVVDDGEQAVVTVDTSTDETGEESTLREADPAPVDAEPEAPGQPAQENANQRAKERANENSAVHGTTNNGNGNSGNGNGNSGNGNGNGNGNDKKDQ